ncbi:aminopeptidase [Streptomyces abyssalis]|uniref:Aminopeptidase N n=2 Tax=Streptomyces abyssalis TaxID=933944 RepID=A0A1E7JM25_9ACTN|nr:aminopeptidase N [Streptomyces abyssalis]OEU88706.1 aminopeptidase [Streptomyces abyssalis]OEU89441.1 aminopeptidase [Streptomyces abyssalis]
MSALTRDEAQTRAGLLDVERYVIDLDVTCGEEVFASATTVRFSVKEGRGGADSFVEVRPEELLSAELDGVALDPETAFADGRLWLRGLAEGAHELRVGARMRYSRVGEGMHRFTDPADGRVYLYSMCFLANAPLVFACFDQPDLKAVFEVSVTAPDDWTVLGNGVARRAAGGRWECAPTPPLSTYLVAVVAGPYHSVRTEHAGLPFGLHVRRSLAEFLEADADELLDITRRCFDRYHEIFDEPYPFDSYDQAFVPEFNPGAMENPGLVTFADTYVFRSAVTELDRRTRGVTVAHEMAHMWFGDLVTLRWWDDIWLNESFAEYVGYQTLFEATRFSGMWADFAAERKSWGYDADQRQSTHPVAPVPESVPDAASALLNFDGISYAKGASVLRQLVAWLGEKDFLAGVNRHLSRHRFGNASLADFIDALAGASERDVHGWAERWLRTTGVDRLSPRVAEGSGQWSVALRHEGSRPHRVGLGLYDLAPADPGRLVLRERLEREVAADEAESVVVAGGPRPDLLLVNDGDLTYAKVRLDEVSWRSVRGALSGLPDAMSRAVVWNAARDMVRDGELPPGEFLEVVRVHAPAEGEVAVLEGVLSFACDTVAERFLPAAGRGAALELLGGVCREVLSGAGAGRAAGAEGGPGGGGAHAGGDAAGRRLTAVRRFIDCAVDPVELYGWWEAGSVPGGPVLDPELRWRLLLRLSVLGAVGGAEIDAELAADPSAAGEEGAVRCRAALPDAGGKEAAWEAMFFSDGLSNYLLKATAEGFWQAGQREFLDGGGFAERYFADAVPVAARRGPAVAAIVGRTGFPRTVVDECVLRRGAECVEGAGVTPALRREWMDQLDDLRRALRVRGLA